MELRRRRDEFQNWTKRFVETNEKRKEEKEINFTVERVNQSASKSKLEYHYRDIIVFVYENKAVKITSSSQIIEIFPNKEIQIWKTKLRPNRQ